LARNLLKLFAERRLGVLGSKFRTRLVVGGLLLSFLPVIMMFWFAYGLMNNSLERWFSRPVEEVREDTSAVASLVKKYAAQNARAEAESITGSTIHRRVPEPKTNDEVGRLARTMNAMLGRLDESSQRQRQFVSDASHELRSPLSPIINALNVMQQMKTTDPIIEQAGNIISRQVGVMVQLVDDLLDITRITKGKLRLKRESCSVS
jgi:signal transduction histidine kinase